MYSFTKYFENEVIRKRPYLKKEWCMRIIENPIRFEAQGIDRFRFWGEVPELDNRIIRVITLKNKTTIHNAFPDRRFKK